MVHENMLASSHSIRAKETLIEAVSKNGRVLRDASSELRDDEDVCLAAVKQNGMSLEHASDSQKDNRTVVVAAVRNNSSSLYFASGRMKSDRELISMAVRRKGAALMHASLDLQNDHQIVLMAVRQDGWALEHASPSLRDDTQIVEAAVSQYGLAIKYASERLRADPNIILSAITKTGSSLRYASPQLNQDADFILRAIRCNADALQHVQSELRSHPRVQAAATDIISTKKQEQQQRQRGKEEQEQQQLVSSSPPTSRSSVSRNRRPRSAGEEDQDVKAKLQVAESTIQRLQVELREYADAYECLGQAAKSRIEELSEANLFLHNELRKSHAPFVREPGGGDPYATSASVSANGVSDRSYLLPPPSSRDDRQRSYLYPDDGEYFRQQVASLARNNRPSSSFTYHRSLLSVPAPLPTPLPSPLLTHRSSLPAPPLNPHKRRKASEDAEESFEKDEKFDAIVV